MPLSKLKKFEINLWISFSPHGSGSGASLAFPDHNFVLSSDIESVRPNRHGIWGLDVRYRSRFLSFGVITRELVIPEERQHSSEFTSGISDIWWTFNFGHSRVE